MELWWNLLLIGETSKCCAGRSILQSPFDRAQQHLALITLPPAPGHKKKNWQTWYWIMKVLVLGETQFIGRLLVEMLLEQNDDVTLVNRGKVCKRTLASKSF